MLASSRNYKYFWSLLPGVVTVTGNLMGGWWVLANLIFSIGILSFVEWFFPEDKRQESDPNPFVPNLILGLHVVVQVLSLSALIYSLHLGKIQGWQIFWVAVSTGIHSGSSSIIVAHEMIHRKNPVWQALGKFLLFSVSNIYFYVDHLRVHHKWVGTERDPATAKFGENLYSFFVRSVLGQLGSAWKVESSRLKNESSNPYGMRNYLVVSSVMLVVFYALLGIIFGKVTVLVFALQSLTANFLLEYTNYIEHYGLSRNEKERVNESHSWQTDKVISRFLLIDLCRHSDHHYFASKPYHTLVTYKQSPVLPGGYTSAIYMALIPPVWFYVMHKRLSEYKETLQKNQRIHS
ncbi:MAG TPA: alkane 1-monooxygenase [Bacteroidia bacterium]|nr:alkane 1-monooxygenase [Bacteroidia bacterium]